jgi:hypothetical protein
MIRISLFAVDDDGVVHFDADAHERFVIPTGGHIDDGHGVRGNTNYHAPPAIASKMQPQQYSEVLPLWRSLDDDLVCPLPESRPDWKPAFAR